MYISGSSGEQGAVVLDTTIPVDFVASLLYHDVFTRVERGNGHTP
jgi:hypothetical protein